MVRLTRIYTRGGDGGETSLGDGSRVAKQALRVEAYGTVDEANAAIGLARLHTAGEADAMLARIQNDLFDLGADLCDPGSRAPGRRRAAHRRVPGRRGSSARSTRSMPRWRRSIPSCCRAARRRRRPISISARTIVRRAERLVAALAAAEPVNPEALKYLNRLSDHLFVLSRHVNDRGAQRRALEAGRVSLVT